MQSRLNKDVFDCRVIRREDLTDAVCRMVLHAPLIAQKAEPGMFVIVRADADGERIPLTIADYDREEGTVTLIFQKAGRSTMALGALNAGDRAADLAGPLGCATRTEGLGRVCVVGGGVGCAIAYPAARKLHENGCEVHGIIGFRGAGQVILQEEFQNVCGRLFLMTDDGTAGEGGFVTDALRRLLENGERYDEVFAVGPLRMMQSVCEVTRPYGIHTVVSMNPIMIDGTGMCGGCRVTVDGQPRFACVDGPEFDGHLVDFDEAIRRCAVYRPFEQREREKACRLLAEGGR